MRSATLRRVQTKDAPVPTRDEGCRATAHEPPGVVDAHRVSALVG